MKPPQRILELEDRCFSRRGLTSLILFGDQRNEFTEDTALRPIHHDSKWSQLLRHSQNGIGTERTFGVFLGAVRNLPRTLMMSKANLKRKPSDEASGHPSGLGWVYAACRIGLLLLLAGVGSAAAQNSAQLTVSITVQSSLQLVFQNNPNVGSVGFCPLTNPNTNNVGLDLGIASAQGGSDSSACVAYSYSGTGHSQYQVASAFDVVVSKSNSSSPNYRLAAEISSLPPTNVSWLVDNVTLNNSSFTTLDTSDTYSTPVTKTLQVQVSSNVSQSILQETVTFLATAN